MSKSKSKNPATPVSEKRLAANRANAARSTGPRTPEGKARSSQNARKHGLAASGFTVIRVEDAESVARLRADLIAVYQPVNSQELFAIERMALAQQSLLRAAQLEAGLLTIGLNNAIEDETLRMSAQLVKDLPISYAQSRGFFMTQGFRGLCQAKGNDPWRVFLRYQAQAERNYRRALEEFERLKALRSELPNEPTATMQTEPQPEEFKNLSTYDPTRGYEPDPDPVEPQNPVPPPSSKPCPAAPDLRR